ncbi:EIN3-binding F-box protein 1-like [Rhododendron vialii]|uniref:EIN3-binding F-box protein 1-like n=1 Tax=Rhododendron vialii TaxID=182163 RepID=UPI00265DF75F|nr:EIN3-binding F-box protein 1-like [Rhododendron vialii]
MLNWYDSNDKVAAQYITDDGVDALASKLKELKKVVIKGNACSITDKSLISLSTNCVKLRGIKLCLYDGGQHYVTEDGIDFVVRHSPNLTSLSLKSRPLQPSTFSFTIGNPLTHAKNLHSLTMFQELVTDKRICSVAKARPPLKKLKLVGFMGQYDEIHGALKLLLQACQLTLEELTLRSFCHGDTTITELVQYLPNLTSIELDEHFGLTSVTFYTLTKYCPLLEKLVMARPKQVMDTSSPEYFHRNYRINCLHLTNVGIGEVLRRCPAITKLNINDLKVSGLFGRYSDHPVLNLKTLKARGTEIDDKGMAMIGNRCRNLQYLDIECCNEVTDRGVMEVVRNCERLSRGPHDDVWLRSGPKHHVARSQEVGHAGHAASGIARNNE